MKAMEQSEESKEFDVIYKQIVDYVKKHNSKGIYLTIDNNGNMQFNVSFEMNGIVKKEIIKDEAVIVSID